MQTSTAIRCALATAVIAIGVVQHYQAKKAHKKFVAAFNAAMKSHATSGSPDAEKHMADVNTVRANAQY